MECGEFYRQRVDHADRFPVGGRRFGGPAVAAAGAEQQFRPCGREEGVVALGITVGWAWLITWKGVSRRSQEPN
jgi:hypothetical protein